MSVFTVQYGALSRFSREVLQLVAAAADQTEKLISTQSSFHFSFLKSFTSGSNQGGSLLRLNLAPMSVVNIWMFSKGRSSKEIKIRVIELYCAN